MIKKLNIFLFKLSSVNPLQYLIVIFTKKILIRATGKKLKSSKKIFAIHFPFLHPSFFRREEKRGKRLTKVVVKIMSFCTYGIISILSNYMYNLYLTFLTFMIVFFRLEVSFSFFLYGFYLPQFWVVCDNLIMFQSVRDFNVFL